MEAESEVRRDFIEQWGVLGSSWGISRTMGEVHALLLSYPHPLQMDEVMAELQISRGNASMSLRDLVDYGLIHIRSKPGERKLFYEAEKDTWKLLTAILRRRREKEIRPTREVLTSCRKRLESEKEPTARTLHDQLAALENLVEAADIAMVQVTESPPRKLIPGILKLLGIKRKFLGL